MYKHVVLCLQYLSLSLTIIIVSSLVAMTRRGNKIIPNAHFRKHWQQRVKTWFNQPGQKKKRRVKRLRKAAAVAPRPADGSLRPVVRCPTARYNIRTRLGRGFSLDELKVGRLHPATKCVLLHVLLLCSIASQDSTSVCTYHWHCS